MNDRAHTDPRYRLSALTGRTIAAAQVVHHGLGPAFEEVIYQRALGRELPAHGLEHDREVEINIAYSGEKVVQKRVDFVVGDATGDVMVEIKAKGPPEDADVIQALCYLKASDFPVRLLLNLGGRRLQIKRLANYDVV